jgi:2-keto-4-pentenoate hydratase
MLAIRKFTPIPVIVALSLVHAAERPDAKALRSIAGAYQAKKFAEPTATGLPYEAALATQKSYVELIGRTFGQRAGYKVGLVTPAGQQRYKISHPVRGVLFEKMLLPNNSTVPVKYGTRPIVEPDLLVRVKDAGLNDAKTIEDAARHLSEIICFIELADGIFATNAAVDAGILTLANVGARAGILGESRKVEASADFIQAFGRMSLVFQDKDGKEVSRVTADGVMGHPLNAVLWLVNDLKRTGEKLKPGDVISLGSPSPAVTPQPGDKYTLIYEGLPGGPLKATVTFE